MADELGSVLATDQGWSLAAVAWTLPVDFRMRGTYSRWCRPTKGDAMEDPPVAVTLRFMREVNTMAVLARLRENESLIVSEIARATGLSRQAVTRVLDELQSQGLVEYLAPVRPSRGSGRPAQAVRLRAEAGYVVGGLIDPQGIHLAVADLRGTIRASSHVPLGAAPPDQHVLGLLVRETEAVLERANITVADVWSATIGAPGIVDRATGVIRTAPSMPMLTGDVLVETLSKHLACTVHLDNDLKLATRGELWRGSAARVRHLVLVHWGERVGAGIVIDGELHRGASNDAGDLGFLDILASGATTIPGYGRFESWVGVRALAQLVADELEAAGDPERAGVIHQEGEGALDAILTGIGQNETPYLHAVDRLARRFSHGIVALRTILDPELVILSGPLAQVGQPLLDALDRALAAQPLVPPALQISALGRDAVVHGALRHSLDLVEARGYTPIERRGSASSANLLASPVLADEREVPS